MPQIRLNGSRELIDNSAAVEVNKSNELLRKEIPVPNNSSEAEINSNVCNSETDLDFTSGDPVDGDLITIRKRPIISYPTNSNKVVPSETVIEEGNEDDVSSVVDCSKVEDGEAVSSSNSYLSFKNRRKSQCINSQSSTLDTDSTVVNLSSKINGNLRWSYNSSEITAQNRLFEDSPKVIYKSSSLTHDSQSFTHESQKPPRKVQESDEIVTRQPVSIHQIEVPKPLSLSGDEIITSQPLSVNGHMTLSQATSSTNPVVMNQPCSENLAKLTRSRRKKGDSLKNKKKQLLFNFSTEFRDGNPSQKLKKLRK